MWRPGNWSSGNTPSASPPPQNQSGNSFLSRSYSPASIPGRRSNARPQPNNRGSSISLGLTPNSSTASLQGSLRQQQNVGYRRAMTMPPPPGVRDPLDVLEGILGAPVNLAGDGEAAESGERPELEEGEIDFGGQSLEEFVQAEDEKEKSAGELKTKIREYSAHSVEEYEKEQDKFQDLHRSIKACDEVLKSVESYLYAFQTDLGLVSAEIETLQNRSTALNRRLENRKNVEKVLGPVVEDIALSPSVVRRIVEGEVNDSWVKALKEAERKIKSIESRDPNKVKAVQDVKPELERLTHKAIERVRDFFVTKIKSVRIPGANAQIIQQNGFLRYKELFQFMASHHPQLAEEISQAYINTMRWFYLSHFTRYLKTLEKLKIQVMDKNDTIGHEEPARRNNLLLQSLKSTTTTPSSHDPFNIGRRIDTLKNRTAPILHAPQAEEDKTAHYPEYPFRHFNVALVENTSAEYSFITEFFAHKTYEQVSNMFASIFSPTFEIGKAFTKTLIDSTLDSLGVLLCVRLNQYSAFELQKRRVPVADGYINATNMLLWPRFQIVMDAHCESLRNGASGKGGAPVTSAAPHVLTQRFAAFVQGILSLSREGGDDEPVANSLGRLRSDYEVFLTKLSGGIADSKKRERFLFNNYSLVATIISDTEGKLASEQKQHFEALKSAFKE